MTRVTHELHGDHVLVSVDLPTHAIVATDAGGATVTMQDVEWRQAARAVLRECNAAEFKLPAEAVVQRVCDSLADAARRAAAADSADVAKMRFASTVLHRLADMVQAGTIQGVDVSWSRDDAQVVRVMFSTERRNGSVMVKLGVGVVDEQLCGCPSGLLDDRGWPIHIDGCELARRS